MKILIFLVAVAASDAVFFPHKYPSIPIVHRNGKGDPGEPLFLTPYLVNGSIEEAQRLSMVPSTDRLGIASYAGFFTVDQRYNSNMYFWYFPPASKRADAPVVLWLQGGPGASSLFGLFIELGPLTAEKEGFGKRELHWALDNHLLFIDNPVGTGFSFTNHEDGYCKDEECVGEGLHNAMQQFFTLFPNLRANEFFVTGESYAGKYVPALGMTIHRKNPTNPQKINLQGLAIGNGYSDPVHQIDYASYLYQHGFLGNHQREMFNQYQDKIVNAIKKEEWVLADLLMLDLFDDDISNCKSYFYNYTGFTNYYNFLKVTDDIDMSVFAKMLSNNDMRHDIHVGTLPFDMGDKVRLHLASDALKSVAPYITELLSHYRMLFYNGQLDIICAYPLTEAFLRSLDFDSSNEYKVAPRNIWRYEDEVAGYYKKAGNLTEILVRDAGHMVPHDQPRWALDMITKFIKKQF